MRCAANHICVAEEGGGGKQILLDRGGYKDMDACIMYSCSSLPVRGKFTHLVYCRCHPAAGPPHYAGMATTNAMQPIDVEFFGQTYVPFTQIMNVVNLLFS
jgi:hypothetical protein